MAVNEANVKIEMLQTQLEEVRAENRRLTELQHIKQIQPERTQSYFDDLERYRNKMVILENENVEHVNRLKRAHFDSIQIMKDEFTGQMERIKVYLLVKFNIQIHPLPIHFFHTFSIHFLLHFCLFLHDFLK